MGTPARSPLIVRRIGSRRRRPPYPKEQTQTGKPDTPHVDMPTSADVVVVGGGALGASAAFHLRRLGVRDVVLVERDTLASGSTSKSAGGIRTQFADELNVRIALRSLDEFECFAELTGAEISFRQHGYLFLLDRQEDVKT